jgi:hypothetical protein
MLLEEKTGDISASKIVRYLRIVLKRKSTCLEIKFSCYYQNFHAARAQIHGRIKKGKVDGYPSSALPWLPEDPSDILSIFPFLSDRVFEPVCYCILKLSIEVWPRAQSASFFMPDRRRTHLKIHEIEL